MGRLKRDVLPTLVNGLMYWPFCDALTYRFVPVHLQVGTPSSLPVPSCATLPSSLSSLVPPFWPCYPPPFLESSSSAQLLCVLDLNWLKVKGFVDWC